MLTKALLPGIGTRAFYGGYMSDCDILIVGAGISAATICAALKHKYKIRVVDTRAHLGGNCHDYGCGSGRVHMYGPHIFHTPNKEILEFLSKYTSFIDYEHSVEAEVLHKGKLVRTPFPYSKQSELPLDGVLSETEIIDTYFRGYSAKMWGMSWEDLPSTIKGRVPKDTIDKPVYFPGQYVGFPTYGYARMFQNMFDGVHVALNASETQWTEIEAKKIIYCGRPDRILDKNTGLRLGNKGLWLGFRSLDINVQFAKTWDVNAPVLNICHTARPETRITHYGKLHQVEDCRAISIETPYSPSVSEISPYYPVPTEANINNYKECVAQATKLYPNMLFLGRLGTYKYLDMHQAVGQALALANSLT